MAKYSQQLLVEGNDDLHVISSLCEKFEIKESFEIKDCEGKDKLLDKLPTLLKGSGSLTTIGVVLDADTDLNNRWKEVCDILKKSGKYEDIPETCDKNGTIIFPKEEDDIKVGVWLMPNNNDKGMLEDFISFLISEDDKLLPKVDKALSEIEEEKLNQYKEIHKSKARIHTWLAWQEDPGTPMGLAITKKYLSTTPIICQDFISWLNKLFNLEIT
jgi:hypothetical protein